MTGKGCALLMEQGCGKTITALAIAGRGYLDGHIKRVLVVAPLSVIPVWQQEFMRYAVYEHSAVTLTGTANRRVKALRELSEVKGKMQVAIINYEAVWRRDMLAAITEWNPCMVIADESQKIKGPSTKQSKGLHYLGKIAKYRLALTGTPITGSPLDFFSQYKFLEPTIFGSSFYSFRNRYAQMGGFRGKQVVGYQNMPELIRKAHSIAYRITKEEALDLPDFVDQELYCELEPAIMRQYRDFANTSVAAISKSKELVATNVLTRLLRLQQFAGGFIPNSDGKDREIVQISKAKINLLADVLEDTLTAGKKAIVFARFIPEINAIKKLAKGLAGKDGYGAISGGVAMEERGKIVHRFQTDPDMKVFIAQIQTAGLGLTLTAADTAIFYSMDFSFANYEQAKARLHRIGQKNNVTYIHLLTKDTVDERIYETLKQKKSIADDVVDNWRQYFAT